MKIPYLVFISLLSMLGITHALHSQKVLLLEEAIQIAMEENYGIKIAMLEQKADEMQVYKSNAGYGPTVDLNGNFNLTGNNVNQVFIDDRTVSRYGRVINPNADVSLGLTLFDGGRMEATYDRLGQLSELSVLEGKVIIQNTIINVMSAYYDINRQKERVSFLETIIDNYEERLNITEQRWNVGRGSKIDYLQSKTDLNAQLSTLVTVKNNLRNAKVTLNALLNREPYFEFDTSTLAPSSSDYNLEDMIALARTNNREILLLQKAMVISQTQEKVIEAATKPQVGLTGRLGYTWSSNNAGFLKTNRTIAATIGIGATYNLYDGHHTRNQMDIAKVNTDIIAIQQAELEVQIVNDLSFAYNQFLSDQELLQFEIENQDIAEENLNISLEKFRLGGSTILELNEAQRAYDTALDRLVNAQYSIRLSELELLRLSGGLVE